MRWSYLDLVIVLTVGCVEQDQYHAKPTVELCCSGPRLPPALEFQATRASSGSTARLGEHSVRVEGRGKHHKSQET